MDASSRTDLYPSRDGTERLLPRRDPVVAPGERSGPLSQATREAYARHGFVVIPPILDAEALAAIHAVLARDASSAAPVETGVIREEGSREVRSIFAVHDRDDALGSLARHPVLIGAARQILGDDVYVHQSRVNFKPSLGGAGFGWHSDFETWHAEDGMPAMRAVSASVMLDENTAANGPLLILSGSHQTFVSCPAATPPDHYRASLVTQEIGTPSRTALRELHARGCEAVAITGAPGSVVLFDCNVLHASGTNLSPRPRRNVFLVYNAVSNALREPFAAPAPRPTFLAARELAAKRDGAA